jgi:hypothetical protein
MSVTSCPLDDNGPLQYYRTRHATPSLIQLCRRTLNSLSKHLHSNCKLFRLICSVFSINKAQFFWSFLRKWRRPSKSRDFLQLRRIRSGISVRTFNWKVFLIASINSAACLCISSQQTNTSSQWFSSIRYCLLNESWLWKCTTEQEALLACAGKFSKTTVLNFSRSYYANDYAARKKYIHIPIEYYYYCHLYGWRRRCFGLVIGFVECSLVVTTNNCNIFTITVKH